MCGQFSLVRQGDFHLDIRLIVLRVIGNKFRVGRCLGLRGDPIRFSVQFPFQRTRNHLVRVGVQGIGFEDRSEIAESRNRVFVGGHIDISLFDTSAVLDVGCGPLNLYQERLLQGDKVACVQGSRMEGRENLIAVAIVIVVFYGAGVQGLADVVFVRPFPPASNRGVVNHGYFGAGEDVAGRSVNLVRVGVLPSHQLLAVAQRSHAIAGADIQRGGADGEGQVLCFAFIAVRPLVVGSILQLQRDGVASRVRSAVVDLHGVVVGIGHAGLLKLPVVDRGRHRGDGYRSLAHGDSHPLGENGVVFGILRGEDREVAIGPHLIQLNGRILPADRSGQISEQGIMGIGGRHLDGDITQFVAHRCGVLGAYDGNPRYCLDNREGIGSALPILPDQHVQIRIGGLQGGFIESGNPDLCRTQLHAVLRECDVTPIIVCNRHICDRLSGIIVCEVQLNLQVEILDRPLTQRNERVIHRIRHIQLQLQADLGIHSQQDLRGAVFGLQLLVGDKHNLVHFLTVVRGGSYNGFILPAEGAADGLAGGGGNRGTGQGQIAQLRPIGDVEAALGVGDAGGNIHGLLQDIQCDVLAVGGSSAVVIGVGNGYAHRIALACVVLRGVHQLLHRHGELVEIVGAVFVLGKQRHCLRHEVLHTVKLVQPHRHCVFVRNGIQGVGHDASHRIRRQPVGLVAAIAHGARGDHHREGLFGKARTRPADEIIALRRGILQHDFFAFDGVFVRIGLRRFAADKVNGDGVDNGLPLCGQGDIPHRPGGDAHTALSVGFQRVNACHIPAQEVVARAGGVGNGQAAALNTVADGVSGGILAAAQLVGDGVLNRLPAGVQGHIALNHIGIQVNPVGLAAVLGAEPAQEFIVLPLGIRGNVLDGHAHMLQSHGVGLFLLAVVQLVGQNGSLLPTGIEGHAAGELIFLRIHGLAGAVGGQIPAEEIMAVVVGQQIVKPRLAHLMGGVGVAGVLGLVTGEDGLGFHDRHRLAVDLLIPPVHNIGRPALRSVKVHGDIYPPVGIQGDVFIDLRGEVKGLLLTRGVVIPAREGQSLHIGVGGLGDGLALLHLHNPVGFQVAVVILERRPVVAHALQGDRHVVGRHGEGDRGAVGGILQSLGLGDQADLLIAVQQLHGNGDRFAGDHGGQLGRLVVHQLPGSNALPGFHRKLAGKAAQRQNDNGFALPSGDHQSAGNGTAAIQAHHDRPLGSVEGGTVGSQRPAVLLARHGLEGHGLCRVAAGNRKHGARGRFGGFDDVGDLTAVAGVTAGEQVEGQVVLRGGGEQIIAHGVAVGRQVAHVADPGNAVLHGAVHLVEGGIEPGQRRAIDFGVALLHRGDYRVQIDGAGGAGFHGAAQNVGILEGGFIHHVVLPVGFLDAPCVGTPVVKGDVHVDGGGGHLELPGQRERHPVVLDQFGLILVLVGQHHIAIVVGDLIGGGLQFIRVDGAQLAVLAVADIEHSRAGVVSRNGFAVDADVLQRQTGGNIALLQVLKQQLVFGAFGCEHVIGLHGDIWDGEDGLDIGFGRGQCPHILQLTGLNHAHGHSHGLGVQRPAMAPECPGLLIGDDEHLDLDAQLDFNVYTHFHI